VPLILASLEAAALFLAVYLHAWLTGRSIPAAYAALLAEGATLMLCGLFAFHFNDLYDLRRVRRFSQFAVRLPQALVLQVLLAGLIHVLVPFLQIGWRALAETLLLALLLILPLRAAVHHLFGAHPFSRRVLVLGTTQLAGKLVRAILDQPNLRDVVVGVVDDGSAAFRPVLPCMRLGSIGNFAKIIEGFRPGLIVDTLPEPHEPWLVRQLLAPRARGIPIEDGVAAYERLTGKIAIEYATPRAVLFSRDFEASWLTLAIARALSTVVALCAIVVLAPLLLPVALLIKLDSEGPVFFLHERAGLGGRPFKLIKFRTMHPGKAPSEWAADNGHRTTRVGRWLRRFRIDELPQFLNVLQGDMNLVGPRPHPVSNLDLFDENIPYYGLRCSVRPGVTGWAQIQYGYANDLEQETEKMRYDLHYIKHMSFALDLRILFETAKVVLKGGRSSTLPEDPSSRTKPIYFGVAEPPAGSVSLRLARPASPTPHEPQAGPAPEQPELDKGVKDPRATSPGVA
jgi:exopolysaccharide biosynthesis polyprenyl glycosylphosphotransferase